MSARGLAASSVSGCVRVVELHMLHRAQGLRGKKSGAFFLSAQMQSGALFATSDLWSDLYPLVQHVTSGTLDPAISDYSSSGLLGRARALVPVVNEHRHAARGPFLSQS